MSDHPVVEVSWYGATAFAAYYGWRLPTEWEWQAAADYDGSYTYGCGTSIDHSKANYDLDNPLNLSSYPYTTPVGYYDQFGYGLCDMAGNVWEWTDSWYSSSQNYRVLRGGGWSSYDLGCTVSARGNYGYPHVTYSNEGFRVVRP
jgi:formylglycine-generating enzyme required for sulfatase activity